VLAVMSDYLRVTDLHMKRQKGERVGKLLCYVCRGETHWMLIDLEGVLVKS